MNPSMIQTSPAATHHMYSAHHGAWSLIEGERAFGQAVRSRRRASLTCRLFRRCLDRAGLLVHDERTLSRSSVAGTVREIELDAITGTTEPSRAREFDAQFRPTKRMRHRWLRVWAAEHTGPGLPPISVLFSAFLGYNPAEHLLGPHVLAGLSAHDQSVLTGSSFFPQLISGPFRHGLHAAFIFAIAACLIAAAASAMRGRRPVRSHDESVAVAATTATS